LNAGLESVIGGFSSLSTVVVVSLPHDSSTHAAASPDFKNIAPASPDSRQANRRVKQRCPTTPEPEAAEFAELVFGREAEQFLAAEDRPVFADVLETDVAVAALSDTAFHAVLKRDAEWMPTRPYHVWYPSAEGYGSRSVNRLGRSGRPEWPNGADLVGVFTHRVGELRTFGRGYPFEPETLFLDAELLHQTLKQEDTLAGLVVAVLVVAVTGVAAADENTVGSVAKCLEHERGFHRA
jgi:hypothetical protein